MTGEELALRSLSLMHGKRYDDSGNCMCGEHFPCVTRQVIDMIPRWNQELRAEEKVRAMDKTQVSITLSFTEIKGLCEAIGRYPDEVCEPGEKMLAKHILGIIERNFNEH